jgi:hypothetical protein
MTASVSFTSKKPADLSPVTTHEQREYVREVITDYNSNFPFALVDSTVTVPLIREVHVLAKSRAGGEWSVVRFVCEVSVKSNRSNTVAS